MVKKRFSVFFLFSILAITLLISGCSGTAERVYGLEPEAVVKTSFADAKANKLAHAAAYVAPSALADANASEVTKLLTGFAVDDLKTVNLLSVKEVSVQGDFAAVMATFHQENTLKVSVKTIGLERIENEWYIVPVNRIVTNAKYHLLAELIGEL